LSRTMALATLSGASDMTSSSGVSNRRVGCRHDRHLPFVRTTPPMASTFPTGQHHRRRRPEHQLPARLTFPAGGGVRGSSGAPRLRPRLPGSYRCRRWRPAGSGGRRPASETCAGSRARRVDPYRFRRAAGGGPGSETCAGSRARREDPYRFRQAAGGGPGSETAHPSSDQASVRTESRAEGPRAG
jgi:hypothetical protein